MGDVETSCGSTSQALAEAECTKSEGNALFGAGMHQEAAELYKKALNGLEKLTINRKDVMATFPSANSQLEESKVTLRSNLAACFLATGQHLQASSESEAALKLDPLHIKSRLRLAKALFSLGRVRDAAEAMSVAVALALPKRLDGEVMRLYNELAGLCASLTFNLPIETTSSIACVESSHDLAMALSKRKSVVVLKPGSYTNSQSELNGPLSLIGIGQVEIVSHSHPLFVTGGNVFASHLKLFALWNCSAACVAGENARLTLVDCAVRESKDTGLLVTEQGTAVLERCSFINLKKQAVEVREGGSVELRGCLIRNCHQGVTAYGGARRLEITNCDILHNNREGVLANGETRNAATRAQNNYIPNVTNNPASIAAVKWAQEARVQLEVVISSSVVTDNGYFGLSLDLGAQVSVINCVLLDNAPYACFVKGATNTLLSGCHIECRKGMEGVHVGINYGANVMVSGNTFIVGDSKTAIVEEMSANFTSARNKHLVSNALGAWSRPVTVQNNKIFVGKRAAGSPQAESGSSLPSAPSLESLAARKVEELEGRKSLAGVQGTIKSRSAAQSSESAPRNLHALVRPCRQLCRGFTKVPEYYAIGNTFGYDLSLGQTLNADPAGSNVNVFLGACGDIRNLLKTVFCMRQRLDRHVKIQIILNDVNMSILARDIVLISLISLGVVSADLVAIWANHAITVAQRELLERVLDDLGSSLPEWLTLPAEAEFQLSAELSEIFSAWRNCTMSLQELSVLHNHNITLNTSVFESAVKLAEDAVGHSHFNKQIREHIQSGNVCKSTKCMKSANPLMLEAPTLQYLLYWSSSIYRAIKIDGVKKSNRHEELYEVLLQSVTPQIEAVAEALKGTSDLRVAVVPGDILDALLFGGCQRILSQLQHLPPSAAPSCAQFFDFIDLSNIADYVSLPAVVQAALPLLKVASHARLHVQSMQWRNLGLNPNAFLRHSVGMEIEIYQELLGVSMQCELSVGSVLRTQWAWNLPISQETSSSSWLTGATVLLEIMSAANLQYCATDRVTNLPQRSEANSGNQMTISGTLPLAGLDCSSPTTLLHLLHLSCPSLLLPLVRVLIGPNGTQRKRKWELLGQVLMQTQPLKSQQSFIRAEFKAKAQYYKLLACAEMPMCVVLSSVPLLQGEEIPNTAVVQLIEAFAYSCESDCVEFLLQRALVENPKCKAYFVTLCVVANSTSLEAVGMSVEMRHLVIDSLTQEGAPVVLPIWMACEGPPATRPWLSRDATLIEILSKLPNQHEPVTTQAAWTTHAVRETSNLVVVELLLPRPFPSSDKASIVVTCSGATMKITIKAVPMKQKTEKKALISRKATAKSDGAHDHEDSLRFALPEQHVIPLPAVVSTGGHIVKLSRQLGLMVVRVPKMT